ncbi:hypothetical protein CFC21_079330 [Triticum aestivum]|nr:probable periplasmic serine endoprotease DegP-like [Aegilops tauschii subsp. strangulata]XP_044398952.1 probable periplasmic serine endoprotease DegP-like [Triticum aestivum]KAF7074468.1 hypothetical protein CFC21_079330 [Triticum aestivum]
MKTNPDPRVLAIAKKARRSVVQTLLIKIIYGKEVCVMTGSGFIMKNRGFDGLVMTNNHVLEWEKEAFDRSQDKVLVRMACEKGGVEQRRGNVLFQDPFVDIAVIHIGKYSEPLPPALSFTPRSRELPVGTSAIAIGYCDADEFAPPGVQALARLPSILPALIAGDGENPNPVSAGEELWVQVDCPIKDGSSGGPVLGAHGVIGVMAQGNAQITAAICTESVHQAVKRWLKLPARDTRPLQEIIDRALL